MWVLAVRKSALVTFLVSKELIKKNKSNSNNNKMKEVRRVDGFVCFDSQFEGTVHLGGEGMAAGT